jgi:tetratricopeptide (TPR) repeat protein
MLAAMGTGLYLFRSARTLAPVENQPTVAWTPELEERRLQEQSARLKLDADEVLDEIDELKNDDAAADETVWKRAESLEAMGRQAYDAQDYETASRRFQTALDVYQSARSAASTAGREVSVGTVQTAPDPDRRAIQAALADYEKALETKDLALFRTVKPNLSSDEERVLEERSRTAGPHDIELRTDNIVIQGEEATAQVTQVMQGDTRKLTFGLQKQGSRWVIVLIEMHQ